MLPYPGWYNTYYLKKKYRAQQLSYSPMHIMDRRAGVRKTSKLPKMFLTAGHLYQSGEATKWLRFSWVRMCGWSESAATNKNTYLNFNCWIT